MISGNSSDRRWILSAACEGADTELFFTLNTAAEGKARKLCNRCPVSTECLAYALDERIPFGLFGGTSAKWRARLIERHPKTASWHAALIHARDVQRAGQRHPRTKSPKGVPPAPGRSPARDLRFHGARFGCGSTREGCSRFAPDEGPPASRTSAVWDCHQ
ncbi:WhiB family transcriptional regulator [Streptomyces sp. NBC_01304]|uniref:WhiB family transcriptional regulator n=1 Tax=Streptomyces sp. NBC_01304 TaxID=2903818 RepID=UPI003FA3A7E1